MQTDQYQLLEQLNSTFYNLLPQARPLHNTSIPLPKSVFVFTSESAPKQDSQSEIIQLLQEIQEGKNENKHEIGNSLAQLFQFPVFQSYDNLELSENNQKFATCSFELSTSLQIQPAKNINAKNSQTKLTFCSQFQSGNLAVASINPNNSNQYFLALQRDTNSKATCQWFYFYVQNKKNTGNYVFSIVNMVKNYSAYQNGMRPCIFSTNGQLGWKRGGFDISYRKNSISNRGDRKYFTFQFSYNFEFQNDRVYFAHSYPYTFTHLQQYLHSIKTLPGSLAQVKTLTRTPLNNPVNIVSITNPANSSDFKNKQRKQLILITARVHPGQTNSSYVCQSLINYLISNEESAINLRNNYIIKIVPFLNPDGVINGNYRTSCTGQDLNRRWNGPDQFLHPEIYSIKKYLTQINLKKALYIDLHGHSKKKSSFMYGCLNKENPYIPKEFPFILSKISSNFSYSNCNFSTPASREGTSRINVWKEFGVDYSYTMEISFCGPSRSKSHFLISDYFKIGLNLGQGISLYFCRKNKREEKGIKYPKQKYENSDKSTKILEPVAQQMEAMFNQFYSQTKLMDQGLSQSSGSESGEQEQQQIQTETQQKKQQKNQISNQQKSNKQIKNLINKNINNTKIKWTRRNFTRDFTSKNQQEQKIYEPTIKKRKSFILSQMSIRKVDLSEQLKNHNHRNSLTKTQNQVYVGQIVGKKQMKINVKMENEKIRGLSLITPKQLNKIQIQRKSCYVPYSLSKAKSHQMSADFSHMLPKVSQQDIRKASKSKNLQKSDYNFDLSICYEPPRSRLNSRLTSYSNRSPRHSHYQLQTHKNLRYQPQKK